MILTDASLRSQVGADHYVVTLREALRVCLEAAEAAAEAAPVSPAEDAPAAAIREPALAGA